MSNQYFNFYYDPVRQGFNSLTWRTLSGIPATLGTRLNLASSEIIHYDDILRGSATISMNIPAPVAGDNKKFGFRQYNKNAYIYFKITDDVLTAETSDGTTSKSVVIDWQTEWTNTDIEFLIKWEAGIVKFYIAGNLKVTIDDASIKTTGSDNSTCISGDPLSLYFSNATASAFLLNYINVKSIQSYLFAKSFSTI